MAATAAARKRAEAKAATAPAATTAPPAPPAPENVKGPEPSPEPTIEELREMEAAVRPCSVDHHINIQKDGLTIGDRVYYRGEEFDPKPGTDEWAAVHNVAGTCALVMTENEQVKKYGDLLYRRGAWDGLGYDPNEKDPLGEGLTDQEKEILAKLNAERGLDT